MIYLWYFHIHGRSLLPLDSVYTFAAECRYSMYDTQIFTFSFLSKRTHIIHVLRTSFPCIENVLGLESVLNWYSACLACMRCWSQFPGPHKADMVTHIYNPRTQEAEVGRTGVQGHPWLHRELSRLCPPLRPPHRRLCFRNWRSFFLVILFFSFIYCVCVHTHASSSAQEGQGLLGICPVYPRDQTQDRWLGGRPRYVLSHLTGLFLMSENFAAVGMSYNVLLCFQNSCLTCGAIVTVPPRVFLCLYLCRQILSGGIRGSRGVYFSKTVEACDRIDWTQSLRTVWET